ncbi:MAG: serine hydroxymethyltransferase [Deltaproteobacteria bacterium]|nr:serine hydroxymethyltransferase [Deltaproteobacteria bacterium]
MSNDPSLAIADPEMFALIQGETQRQFDKLRMIPSENYASRAVQEAMGSPLNNKYSEGYPRKRYYEGQQFVDPIEELAQSRIRSLFGVEHANVQPYSGSPANLAVLFAFCKAGEKIMGLGLPAGGHLTHGWSVSITGAYFDSKAYGVRRDDHRIDMDEVRKLAEEHKPKVIFCGGTAYPRLWDFAAFGELARSVGAILVADIAHISGLIAGGAHPSPVGHADVITSTTHKTLRGPRGGMIMTRKELAPAIDKAVFPGLQGGPHVSQMAALAVAAKEASDPSFKRYAAQVVANAKALAKALGDRGYSLVSGGTDNHLLLIDLTNKNITGKLGAKALDAAGIELNYNSVPFDPRKPFDPSGVRLGTPAITSRGLKEADMERVATWFDDAVQSAGADAKLASIATEVQRFLKDYPAPGIAL